MTDELAKLLRESAFGTMADSRRFIDWFEAAEHATEWDKARYRQALSLRELESTTGPAPSEPTQGTNP